MATGRAWFVATACGAMVLPVLAACGGSSSSNGQPASSSAPAGSSAPAAPATPAAAAAGGQNGGLTAPGAHLSFNQTATVHWVPPGSDNLATAQKGLKLAITVESIEKGTLADFKNVQLDANQRHSTPYYVKLRIQALDSTPPKGHDDPAISLDAIDDRGQQQSSIIFMGSFPRCNDNTPPKHFVGGKSYTSCLTYLMPGGGSIQRVQWADGSHAANQVTPYFEHPIVWAAG